MVLICLLFTISIHDTRSGNDVIVFEAKGLEKRRRKDQIFGPMATMALCNTHLLFIGDIFGAQFY